MGLQLPPGRIAHLPPCCRRATGWPGLWLLSASDQDSNGYASADSHTHRHGDKHAYHQPNARIHYDGYALRHPYSFSDADSDGDPAADANTYANEHCVANQRRLLHPDLDTYSYVDLDTELGSNTDSDSHTHIHQGTNANSNSHSRGDAG